MPSCCSAGFTPATNAQSVKLFSMEAHLIFKGSAMLESYGMLGNWEIQLMSSFENQDTKSPHYRGGLQFLKSNRI